MQTTLQTPVLSPYQDKPDRWSSHSLVRQKLARLAQGSRVLDVGSATGIIGRLCQNAQLEFYGLEPNPTWAEAARPYYREVLSASIETAPDAYLSGYHAVVCADVLEHLPNPQAALARLVDLQPPGSVFLISVPNVANLWVRLQLLSGRFEYTERGILDRTHLRFFTRRSFLHLLTEAGLQLKDLYATPIPLPLVHPFFERTAAGRLVHAALAAATRTAPTLLGYQFVAELVKPI